MNQAAETSLLIEASLARGEALFPTSVSNLGEPPLVAILCAERSPAYVASALACLLAG